MITSSCLTDFNITHNISGYLWSILLQLLLFYPHWNHVHIHKFSPRLAGHPTCLGCTTLKMLIGFWQTPRYPHSSSSQTWKYPWRQPNLLPMAHSLGTSMYPVDCCRCARTLATFWMQRISLGPHMSRRQDCGRIYDPLTFLILVIILIWPSPLFQCEIAVSDLFDMANEEMLFYDLCILCRHEKTQQKFCFSVFFFWLIFFRQSSKSALTQCKIWSTLTTTRSSCMLFLPWSGITWTKMAVESMKVSGPGIGQYRNPLGDISWEFLFILVGFCFRRKSWRVAIGASVLSCGHSEWS